MDLQRTLLIVGLAIVSYMMILQWQEDYGTTAPPQQAQNNSQSYPQAVLRVSDPIPSVVLPGGEAIRIRRENRIAVRPRQPARTLAPASRGQ